MAGNLRTNPMDFTSPDPILWFRGVTVGRSVWTQAWITNDGASDLSITGLALTTGTKFKNVRFDWRSDGGGLSLPVTLPPRINMRLVLEFVPVIGDEDTELADIVTITHNGTNGPTFAFDVEGSARRPGMSLISITPFAWDFAWINSRDLLDGLDIGTWSNVHVIGLINSGDELLEITHITANFPFRLVEPLPELPAVISPGSALQLSVVALADLVGEVIHNGIANPIALEIVSNAEVGGVTEWVGALTGLAITSVFTINGNDKRALAAFGSTIKQFDPSNLSPERPASLVKTVDLQRPHQEKLLARLHTRYEDLGVASFKTTLKTRDETSTPVTSSIGTGAADKFIREALIEKQMNEQVFKLTIDHVAGPVSLVDIGIDFEPRGPVVD